MSLTALLFTCSLASAFEGQPGLWLPGSTSLPARQGRFGAGVVWGEGSGESVLIKGIIAPVNRLALSAEGVVGSGGDPLPDLGVGLRYSVLDKEGFTLAPFNQLEITGRALTDYLGLAGGWAGTQVALDASLSLFAAESQGERGTFVLPPEALRWLEGGVTFYPARQQELRVGALSRDVFQLTLTYRWMGRWWYVEPSLMWWPGDLDARAHAGVRF